MIVERVTSGGGGSTWAEIHEGVERITLEDLVNFATEQGLDPAGVYVSPEVTCYGESSDHDKHLQLMWTLSNRHPRNSASHRPSP